jgi:exodeoxyribonuclease VII large subunit
MVPPGGTPSASTSPVDAAITPAVGQNRGVSQPAFDLEFDDGAEPTYSVSELADAVNGVLRSRFGDGVWVRGEIQGYSERGAHAYFRIVESGDNGKAVLDVALFANIRMRLRPILQKHRLQLADGMKVRIFGSLDFYAPTGRLSLKMAGIDPRYTLGEMALQRDEIVRRLVASGAYDSNRRRTVAAVPLRLGVITSIGSAAWHDFTHELELSGFGFALQVVDVRVQGDFASDMVTDAINQLSNRGDLDVLIIIRGGGSRSELAAFDTESIARAIAASPLPVFTGIGHEIDRSVADEVAHSAFKTPTACAGALIERVQMFLLRAESAWGAISALAARQIEQSATGLYDTARRIEQRTVAAIERGDQRLTDRSHRVAMSCKRALDKAALQLDGASTRVGRRALQYATQELQTLGQIEARVRLLDPVHTLARGWSLTRTTDGHVVRTAAELAAGTRLVTTFAAGHAYSTVDSVDEEPPTPDPQGTTDDRPTSD